MRAAPSTRWSSERVRPSAVSLVTRKCDPAWQATCGRWVMVTTWWVRASEASLVPTAVAISPPTLASISSKSRTGTASWSASTALTASITREISPLEAMSRSGLAGSPGFGMNRKSTVSAPCGLSGPDASTTSNSDRANPRSARLDEISRASLGAALRRLALRRAAAARAIWAAAAAAFSRRASSWSRFSMPARRAAACSCQAITSARVAPYLRLRDSTRLTRSSKAWAPAGSRSSSAR